jgi:hypothetical protein
MKAHTSSTVIPDNWTTSTLPLSLGCFLISVLASLTGCSSNRKPLSQSDHYKNVVVIVGDDHAYTALCAYVEKTDPLTTSGQFWLTRQMA